MTQTYTIKFHKKAVKEFNKLDGRLKISVAKKIEKLRKKPLSQGKALGKKYGIDLLGCRSLKFDDTRMRIVFSIKERIIEVHILSIGKRSDEDVYKEASKRMPEILQNTEIAKAIVDL
ncbi:type II toxin-antitoxin system RelE/ParE family toxin [Candidatus Peregrinibacteria bacterium]|jgi:mRNA interferase RelE/StbE|nr:type II toxin-antitoxin system RelE/ParE family toxin [Candidatus Peregrinibacteria bacterium]